MTHAGGAGFGYSLPPNRGGNEDGPSERNAEKGPRAGVARVWVEAPRRFTRILA